MAIQPNLLGIYVVVIICFRLLTGHLTAMRANPDVIRGGDSVCTKWIKRKRMPLAVSVMLLNMIAELVAWINANAAFAFPSAGADANAIEPNIFPESHALPGVTFTVV